MLREVTACLDRNRREADLMGRHGGYEFVLLLPETTMDDALVVAERCRQAVENLEVALPVIHRLGRKDSPCDRQLLLFLGPIRQ